MAIYHILWDLVHTLLAEDRGGQARRRHEIRRRIPRPGQGADAAGRDPRAGRRASPAARTRPLQVMEVCGGHTHSIFRYGIQQMLPDEVEFVHGPGCPVCVLPMGRVDDCVALAERPEVIFTTFGDAMRVPGSRKSLLKAKADGADVRHRLFAAGRAGDRAEQPEREVIFFGLGFETTMPSTAMTVMRARSRGRHEFLAVLQPHHDHPDDQGDSRFAGPAPRRVPWPRPRQHGDRHHALRLRRAALPQADHHRRLRAAGRAARAMDGAQQTRRGPLRGREPVWAHRRPATATRARWPQSRKSIELREFFEWRGLGSIDHSGVRLREAYAAFDAERKFAVPNIKIADPKACQCGEVLKGVIKPHQCKVFGTACTPETPLGSLMVSSEGACAAYTTTGASTHPGTREPLTRNGSSRHERPRPCQSRVDEPIPRLRQRSGTLRGDTHHHGARQRRQGDARADRRRVRRRLRQSSLAPLEDQARFPLSELTRHGDRLAFTTDTYVVDPLFFPGGDIGTLAVAGTVNDLAMSGARPLFLSCAVILEEGLAVDRLAARRRQHAAGRRAGRRADRHRRHQGRRARRRRQAVHQHRRHRRDAARA